jgi:hypothetical protein
MSRTRLSLLFWAVTFIVGLASSYLIAVVGMFLSPGFGVVLMFGGIILLPIPGLSQWPLSKRFNGLGFLLTAWTRDQTS